MNAKVGFRLEAALGIIDVDDTVAKLAKTLAYFIICMVDLDVIIGQKVDLVWSLRFGFGNRSIKLANQLISPYF